MGAKGGEGTRHRFGDWLVLGSLDSGGMSDVYLAEGPNGRRAAIKVPQVGKTDRFRREVALARRIHSRFTAEVLDASVDPPEYFVAFEHVEGPTLQRQVRIRGPMGGTELLALAVGLADGLRHIHAAGVVHRDLKPSNIIVTHHGPVIIDFGVAIDPTEDPVTRSGWVIGTEGWLSPEQLSGRRVDAFTDIYNWGLVVRYAAGGVAAWDAADVPDQLRRTVDKALGLEPHHRPPAPKLLAHLIGDDGSSTVADTVDRSWSVVPLLDSEDRRSKVDASLAGGSRRKRVGPRSGSRTRRAVIVAGLLTAAALAVAATLGGGNPLGAVRSEDPSSLGDQADSAPPRTAVGAPDVPRFEGPVQVLTQSAANLLEFAESNVGSIVYLDVHAAEPASMSEHNNEPWDRTLFVPGSYGWDDSDSGCQDSPEYCGVEYLVSNLEESDSGLYWRRGGWRLHGYFAITSIDGPFQGSLSVALRAIQVEDIPAWQ